MINYDFLEIEKKWRKYWEDNKLHKTDLNDFKKKLYCLVMFSYPSGDKLHIGHWYNFGPTDSWARFKKLQGYNVFEPMGFDAFGLPAENYAVKTGVHPAKSTAENISYIRKQLKEMGAMYDWDHEIDTSHPDYYRWTQWVFLKLYEAGLAYKKKAPVNWCPSCMTVLANEQVVDGECERCGETIIKKDLEQWFFKITDYADRLLEDLEKIDWPEKTKIMQRNWIGKSKGAEIVFKTEDGAEDIEVFTTRADTLYGVTYLVLAPEHPLTEKLTTPENSDNVKKYQEQARRQSEIERTSTEKEKTGVFLGSYVVNPVNGEKVPVWISDYVLATYGTGAVMAVPAHDQRDYEFATKFQLPIKRVIGPVGGKEAPEGEAFTDYGVMMNSGDLDGTPSKEGIEKVIEKLAGEKAGRGTINYRLRDWLISRQRYWGAPIPVLYCDKCGTVPVPEKDLPVKLPEDVDFTPRGESPLNTSKTFQNAVCPKCGGPARREVDTMDTFVCSSWYFLRYLTPELSDRPFDTDTANHWLPVDQYVGGAEHAVMHLLYARFITKVLRDQKYISFDEPFQKLIHQGTITRNGNKMSKSRGNVVNPDQYVNEYGSDTFRCYMMFMGSYEDGGDWDDTGIHGVSRFIKRVWRLVFNNSGSNPPVQDKDLNRKLHQTIKKVTEDTERFQFNTAIAAMMEFVNAAYAYLEKNPQSNLKNYFKDLVVLLSPFAPHLCEELWVEIGEETSIFSNAQWPSFDPKLIVEETITVVAQINGKMRGKLDVDAEIKEDEIKELALNEENVKKHLEGKTIKKIIYVPKKLVSIVAK